MRILVLLAPVLAISACATDPGPRHAQSASLGEQLTTPQSPDVARLRGVTRTLIDASTLYRAAADESDNQAYAQQIRALAERRQQMADAFQARVAALGGNPAEIGSPVGTAQRAFLEARQLGNADTKVAVEEALRGENHLLEELSEGAQDMALNAETRTFLSSNAAQVRADRDRLQAYASTL